jgi:hypothetical protein
MALVGNAKMTLEEAVLVADITELEQSTFLS